VDPLDETFSMRVSMVTHAISIGASERYQLAKGGDKEGCSETQGNLFLQVKSYRTTSILPSQGTLLPKYPPHPTPIISDKDLKHAGVAKIESNRYGLYELEWKFGVA
jgi:hypothetical protein